MKSDSDEYGAGVIGQLIGEGSEEAQKILRLRT
jgi:hypothetical protein